MSRRRVLLFLCTCRHRPIRPRTHTRADPFSLSWNLTCGHDATHTTRRYASDATVLEIARKCPLLEELDLGWCSTIKASIIVRDLARCPLKKLFLTANRSVDDECLHILANSCPTLEQIDVLGSKGVTAIGVNALLLGCPGLIFIDLSFCANVESAQLEQWRDLYPNLTIKRSFTR